MPDEHDIPAPVTTIILLHLATDRERSERERLVEESAFAASKSRVTVIAVGESLDEISTFGLDSEPTAMLLTEAAADQRVHHVVPHSTRQENWNFFFKYLFSMYVSCKTRMVV